MPVVSKINGLLFEKSLISKVLRETGKCPVSGSSMTEEDLINVNGNSLINGRMSELIVFQQTKLYDQDKLARQAFRIC